MNRLPSLTSYFRHLDILAKVDSNFDFASHVNDDIFLKILSFALETSHDYYVLCRVNKEFYAKAQQVFPRVFPSSVVEIKKLRLAAKGSHYSRQYSSHPSLSQMLERMDQIFEELANHQSPLYRRKDRKVALATAPAGGTTTTTNKTIIIIIWPRLEPAFFEQIYRFVHETLHVCHRDCSPADRHAGREWRPLYRRYTNRYWQLATNLANAWELAIHESLELLADHHQDNNTSPAADKSMSNHDTNITQQQQQQPSMSLTTKTKISVITNLLLTLINDWTMWQGQMVAMAKTGCYLNDKCRHTSYPSLRHNAHQCLAYHLLFCGSNNDGGDNNNQRPPPSTLGVGSLLNVLLEHLAFLPPHIIMANKNNNKNNNNNNNNNPTVATNNGMEQTNTTTNNNQNTTMDIITKFFQVLDATFLDDKHVPDFGMMTQNDRQVSFNYITQLQDRAKALRIKLQDTKALFVDCGYLF